MLRELRRMINGEDVTRQQKSRLYCYGGLNLVDACGIEPPLCEVFSGNYSALFAHLATNELGLPYPPTPKTNLMAGTEFRLANMCNCLQPDG